jgi:hypothetical protein
MRLTATVLLTASFAFFLPSCARPAGGGAIVWTDVPELALAVEVYNARLRAGAREGEGAIELHWSASVAEALRASKAPPALAVGRYLGSASLRDRFASLDYLLRGGRVNGKTIYPQLLDAGKIGGRRVLLPISFNLPLMVFSRGSPAPGDGFILSLTEMSAPSAVFNKMEGGAYSRMGFSPRWYGALLVSALTLSGAGFAEGEDLAQDEKRLESALGEILSWSSRTNGSAALEDDFQFKYLFAPPYRYVKEGRTLYAYMNSSDFLAAPEGKRAGLDFRWYAQGGRVIVSDNLVCAGLVRGAPGRKAAEAFLKWLLGSEAQRAILERSRRAGELDYSFGVAGGFSSLRSVNEEIFPAYFPSLVGHAPPGALLAASATPSDDWPGLKAEVVAPWVLEATANAAESASTKARDLPAKIRELAVRIADYRIAAARR